MIRNKKTVKRIARVLFFTMAIQVVWPGMAWALTSGPSQPEVQSFEPVGTTDMVDLFSGDFVYNIPLMDVEGYPINISYHGGVNMEQEASWVGLGWNINPGVINRTVRGLPDDFKGDSIMKQMHLKPEWNRRVGMSMGVEPFGAGQPLVNLDLSASTNLNLSNYRGISVDFGFSAGVNLFRSVSAGVNMGVGSQSGASVDYNANLSFNTSQIVSSDVSAGVGIGVGQGYNSRSGLKDLSFSWSGNVSYKTSGGNTYTYGVFRGGATVPIGVKNIVPVITNASQMKSYSGQIKVGGEAAWCYLYGTINGNWSKLTYDEEGSRRGYGYLYPDSAGVEDILDFTRDRDGMFNKNMSYLPVGNMTYDIYSVNGQGTGGSFRPFRNDYGSVYDPKTYSSAHSEQYGLEAGIGWTFSIGGDLTKLNTDITSGPWEDYRRAFAGNQQGSIYESSYFKQAGELTQTRPEYYDQIGNEYPIRPDEARNLPLTKAGATGTRDARGNLIYTYNGALASAPGVADMSRIISYKSTNGFANGPATAADVDTIYRVAEGNLKRKKHHISEIVQVQTDGRKYVYGIAAMNNVQKEVTFAVEPATGTDIAKGLVHYERAWDSVGNGIGRDNFYSGTITPSYAHSFLLTSVLSPDYVDITGNGPSDDDYGTYTKFNYTRKEADYRWRAPIESNKAQYNPGLWSDTKDDKGNYIIGSREQWMLHSIESKNFVAEFYTSPRSDGKGVVDQIIKEGQGYYQAPYNAAASSAGSSYKLDSIKLYNKHDRFINKTSAIPVKTVIFVYDDSLCRGLPNSTSGGGKLTLRKIYIRYGNSDKSMISPYQFTYSACNPDYHLENKDRWGNYKPNDTVHTNYEFPFVDQNDANLDYYASAWSLTRIDLPSGGIIKVDYEADDYAYVQDKATMEMLKIVGVGNSTRMQRGNKLYNDKKNPNLYVYFKRQLSKENPGLSFRQNYLRDTQLVYYNFATKLYQNYYEPVKGYTQVEDVGVCTGDTTYGYIKMKKADLENGKGTLNPVSYTALNFARYHMPHLFFPGGDTGEDDITGVLAGLKNSFVELVSMAKNPIIRFTEDGKGREISLEKSFIRVNVPGLTKKGGGQRVKTLKFYDNWDAMAGGNAQPATYGKQYDYTTEDVITGNGRISSGVASYEPQVGGDENPFRTPIPYIVQDGSKFPPNDPVTLYQEMPIGESLYPGASIGYSKVTVTSIHKEEGRSSQGVDIHEFYTARDFPVIAQATPLDAQGDEHYGFTEQRMVYRYKQGYVLTFNDMHGKPKRNEHRVMKPKDGTSELISYQEFIYRKNGMGGLDNNVQLVKAGANGIELASGKLGVEMDLTIDSREKREETINDAFFVNLNVSNAGPFPIPIPLPIPWTGSYINQYNFAVTTKVIQQYGILSEVRSYQEGAQTTVRNIAFDAVTGQALITSVNNEFQDLEYNVSYPAYWGYGAMGPAYRNIGYETKLSQPLHIDNDYRAQLDNGQHIFQYGDEVLISYLDSGKTKYVNAWVVSSAGGLSGQDTIHTPCYNPITQEMQVGKCPILSCTLYFMPRYKYTTPGWQPGQDLHNVTVTIVRSGNRNQLTESIQSYASQSSPFNGGYLESDLPGLISIKAAEYSNENARIRDNDSLNPYVDGTFGNYHLYKEYAYLKNRTYAGRSRVDGLFRARSLWQPGYNTSCTPTGFMQVHPELDNNWVVARTVTKWSPFGFEIENKDALGNYTSALYGYNHSLPEAIAQNAKHGEVLAESMEGYQLLQMLQNYAAFSYSPFAGIFSLTAIAGTPYAKNSAGGSGLQLTADAAHTGYYSLLAAAPDNKQTIPIQDSANMNAGFMKPFALIRNKKYILSYWIRHTDNNTTNRSYYDLPATAISGATVPFIRKSNIIDGWQQLEATFTVPATGSSLDIMFPDGYYVDDIRVFPIEANMKAFVYHPVSEKLIATLDENNYATFYEYDKEGNLVRTKKETERGIITISESRSANPKAR